MTSAVFLNRNDRSRDAAVHWILRAGTVLCFLGHGSLGLIRVAAWTSYFKVVGISPAHALILMPWVGAFDVALALSVLVFPVRGVVLYMAAWSLWTAMLRPLAGESVWELLERAGNFGVPLALYFCLPSRGRKARPVDLPRAAAPGTRHVAVDGILRFTTVFLLLGHGALGLFVRKPLLSNHYLAIGLSGSALEPIIGGLECLLALAVLLKPDRGFLFAIVGWKLATEALAPLAGASFWVFIEHGGSYAAPLALGLLQRRAHHPAVLPSALSAV